MRHRHRYGPRARSRFLVAPNRWHVHARVERFMEPALLLLLEERSAHGYELLERLPALLGEDARVDMGNLYRILRALEEEGFVRSEWDASAPGPAKRRYELNAAGGRLLYQWVEALQHAQARIETFIERYERAERG
jgi:PadR family transcriptional regulator, regulatory protein PadR